jgi:cytochrome c oxidase subunit 2
LDHHPILILIGSAWPATTLLLRMADTSGSEMTVKVTGYQWKWRYEYVDFFGKDPGINFVSSLEAQSNRARQLGSGIDPASIQVDGVSTYLLDVDKPLVLPTGVKIRFVFTADDVIHAWWVPSLGWKQDAIPGIINSAWTEISQPGTYRGQCAELCGRDHGFMPIVVKAVPKAEFEQWMTAQRPHRHLRRRPWSLLRQSLHPPLQLKHHCSDDGPARLIPKPIFPR